MKNDKRLDDIFYILAILSIGFLMAGKIVLKMFGTRWLRLLPQCYFHIRTGYYCPGCGGTRALIALFHGRILESVYYHPFVMYLTLVGGYFLVTQTIERLSGHRLRIGLHFKERYLWIGLAIIATNFAIKNGLLFLTGHAIMG